MCSVNKLPVAEQEAIKKVLGKEHKTALVQCVGYDMSIGAQRCRRCHAAGGRARGPVRLRYVWYGMLLQLPLALGFQAYRWRCSACKKTYTDYPAGVVAYSRHSVALMYEMMDYLRGRSIAEVSRRYHIAEQTVSNMLLRAVRITPDWDSLRRERELHLVVDEHSCAGKELVITVCEARTKQVLTILHNDLCASLQAFPGSIPCDIKQRVTCTAGAGAGRSRCSFRRAFPRPWQKGFTRW